MFILAAELDRIPASPENLVAVIESINTPNVVLPGHDAEPTQAFIAGLRNADATFSIYIYLLQTQSMRPAVYACEPRSIPLAQYPEVEAEALQFVESMGFMLDNLNFRRQDAEEQQTIFTRLPCFKNSGELKNTKNPPAANETQNALEGLSGLDELEPLEELSPVSDLAELDDLPVVSASPDSVMSSPASVDALLSPLADQFSATEPASAHGIRLTQDERQKIARLLAAF